MSKRVFEEAIMQQSKKRVAFPIELFAESGAFSEAPSELHVVPVGEWEHPVYGSMKITTSDIREFIQNFKDNVRRDIPITKGHDNGMNGGELPAVGWFKELYDRGVNGLWALVEWTDEGREAILTGAFKYFSPEFYEEYEDPETRQRYKHVLVGGALTNKPYFKELAPVAAFSEPSIIHQFNESTMTLKLEEVLAKKVEELTAEEKAFVVEHKGDLTDEQKTAFESVLTESVSETEEEKLAREEKEKGDANEAQGLNRDGSPKKVEGSEKKGTVMISAAELQVLRDKADEGARALQKVEASERKVLISKLVFSETNRAGRFLPKQEVALESFLVTLSEKQRDQFVNIVNNMPKSELFNEKGDGNNTESSVIKEVKEAVAKKMSENKDMKYSEALKSVFSENTDLEKRYNETVTSGEKQEDGE